MLMMSARASGCGWWTSSRHFASRPRFPAGSPPPPSGNAAGYCAQVLAATYQAMGLLPGGRPPGWYDAGRFWSGDHLGLSAGYRLGGEIAVHIPPGAAAQAHTLAAG